MQRIEALNPTTTTGKSKELFEGIEARLGMVPNMMRTMGNSPAVLGAYLNFSEQLGKSTIGSRLGELIAISVANANGCEYCNAAHSFIGEKLVGIDKKTLELAKEGKSADPKTEAALRFSRKLVAAKGRVSNDDINEVKNAGYSDAAVTEIIAHTALNIFTNYFNNAIEVEVDFPKSSLVETAAA
ncbi:carboxymuconolactone decarboxylase family protein [Maribellus maritimus]|uniref:carboxymuconolactone decarboxylase family protein n=1 Tax=Maribellus maritimus TaxID=2870838 RepID=UPI001EEA4CDB|nr:carboxymuconolactone decarboxylase family protein [Maribellus maritimus]MCG6188329.1 carboxymuconolactone decarboxylase family protein [Maribellus maritimus]